eukprot:5659113-Amphidinium_carterae.1
MENSWKSLSHSQNQASSGYLLQRTSCALPHVVVKSAPHRENAVGEVALERDAPDVRRRR